MRVPNNTTKVDVYDILVGFEVTNPAIQHAIKKLLVAGRRGAKDTVQDYKEAIASIERGIDLIKAEEGFEKNPCLEIEIHKSSGVCPACNCNPCRCQEWYGRLYIKENVKQAL